MSLNMDYNNNKHQINYHNLTHIIYQSEIMQEVPHKFGKSILAYDQNFKQRNVIISGYPYNSQRRKTRPGCDKGSLILRKRLTQSNIPLKNNWKIMDAGEIHKDLVFKKAQDQIIKKHKEILRINPSSLIFSIAGSHFQILSNVKCLRKCFKSLKIGIINISPHLDFDQKIQDSLQHQSNIQSMIQSTILEDQNCYYVQFGLKLPQCKNQHLKYIQEKNIKTISMEHIREQQMKQQQQYRSQAGKCFHQLLQQMEKKVDKIMIALDTTAICCKWMSGVSKPNVTGGLSNIQALEILHYAGQNPKLSIFQISEFNPAFQSIFTPTLLIQMFYELCNSFFTKGKELIHDISE